MSEKVNVDSKGLNILTHVLGIFLGSSFVIGFLGPLLIYLVVDNKDVKTHSKNALNWQISYLIYTIVTSIFLGISVILSFILIGIPFLFLFGIILGVLWVLNIVFSIIAAIKANDDVIWEYPLSIKFFK